MRYAKGMKALFDPDHLLREGLTAIRTQFQIPANFPSPVLAAAEVAAKRRPNQHVDQSHLPFVTLDPATSTDLDQAFHIERNGSDLLLHYAIADVAWFVNDGDALDVEAWQRGTSQYLPDGKAGLYPPILAEGVTSLLPDGPRPAIVFVVRVDPDGNVKLDSATRALIQSRAKLAYDSVREDQLPTEFSELANRIAAAEQRRGAARIDPPEQEVTHKDGKFTLAFRPRLISEARNSAMSLATNLAIADVLQTHKTGLFRIMDAPDDRAVKRLRATASAFGLDWSSALSLKDFNTALNPDIVSHAAMMLAIRRAGARALYVPYREGVLPWHAAMAATYAHATAPLRRLADRYVVQATLAIMNGLPVPDAVQQAFAKLPKIMASADALGGQISRSTIDLAEAVMLNDRVGEIFAAVVTDVDERGVRVQLVGLPVVTRVVAHDVTPGEALRVELLSVSPERRSADFKREESVHS
jgi:VacB/RNase II family 3'-5' exoribonuclease